MTFINHISETPLLPQATAHRGVLGRLLSAFLERAELQRQRIALERLDNRLREDIGLPPRPEDTILNLTNISKAYY